MKELLDWQSASWQEAETILSRVTDQMGQRIDAGILAPVVGLNLLGFHTSASCEGHLSWGYPQESNPRTPTGYDPFVATRFTASDLSPVLPAIAAPTPLQRWKR